MSHAKFLRGIDMIIFKYDINKITIDRLYEETVRLKNALPEEKILVIPYGIDILTDCTLEELYRFRNDLNNIIAEKEKL